MQRYFAKEKNNNQFILNSDDLYHIRKVMRMNNHDKIEVVYNHEVYLCEIEIIKEQTNINILSIQPKNDDINIDITLIVPLLKETKMDLILQKATELGVNKIIPIITERSIIKLEQNKFEKKLERWTKICKEASEQSMRYSIPVISEIKKINELKEIEGLKLVCSTTEKKNNIKFFLHNYKNYDKIVVAIGPEGGLSIKEEDLFESNGFSKVTLGNRIMRVETVPLFILSVINYEYME